MDPTKMQDAERERFSKFWRSLTPQEMDAFKGLYNADTDLHNYRVESELNPLRAPTKEEYAKSKPLRKFLAALDPVRVKLQPYYDGPDACLYLPRACTENVSSFLTAHADKRKLEIVFGFKVWKASKATTFFKAEGHVWLRDVDSNEYIDPTPFEDGDSVVMLVESSSFLNQEERNIIVGERGACARTQPRHCPYLPAVVSINTRSWAGCKLDDDIFCTWPTIERHAVRDLRLREPCPLPPESTESMAQMLGRRLKKVEPDFWAWRQQQMRVIRAA